MAKADIEHAQRMKKIEQQNTVKRYREEENAAKYKPKKISASKLIMFAMIMLCLEIIIYAEFIMYTLRDTTALYVLIGIPATLTASIWAYSIKSKAENTQGGLVYEATMAEIAQAQQQEDLDIQDDDGAVG